MGDGNAIKAYVTTIGERTTDICCEQLRRFGFDVVLLDRAETWFEKYKRFVEIAHEDCIRVDADIIVNKNIANAVHCARIMARDEGLLMAQFKTFDFYRNDVGITCPVFYAKEALEIIRGNLETLDKTRPEATAWRIESINKETHTLEYIVGMHGFFQDKEHLDRAETNKKLRHQVDLYDFELVRKILSL